ncbi:MAG: Asp-tRNA(Asn)/Glu-tRNA(Gln) amidotransferase subunit GatC [Methanimicrococcus sp.]|nr:Asp-tRNA(Asn)/Glu-tRNA(Gln) amidotransferase subunit GatC [Methanimicrococcus sp.]
MIQQDETKNLAWMARIAVEESALPEYQEKLNKKLEAYSLLSSAPTENVPKTVNPSRLKTVLRKDIEVPSMSLDDALKNAPEVSGSSFKIPKIL